MKMEMTPEQRAILEQGLTAMETGIGQLNLVIEQYDKQRAEFIFKRDEALKNLTDLRATLGVSTVTQ